MPVYIVLLTYASAVDHPRSEYARITLESTLSHLHSTGSLKVHIADDGSHPLHIASLVKICHSHKIEPSITNAERRGYGASYNLATQHCHQDGSHFLMLEDDWQLTRPLDLDPLVEALDGSTLGCIRLGYIGWTQELSGFLTQMAGMTFLKFHADSPEPHVWAGHPRFENKPFQRRVGPWPEGLGPGETEFSVARRLEARDGVGWPLDLGVNASQQHASCFSHIGAVQARTDQVHA